MSILSSPFSDYPEDDNLHSQFAILRVPVCKQSPFCTHHSQISHTNAVSILDSLFSDPHAKAIFILNSLFSECLRKDSLYCQFTILRLFTWRQSPFSIRHSQITSMEGVSILNLLFLGSAPEESLHCQLAILAQPARRQSSFSTLNSQTTHVEAVPILRLLAVR